MGTAWQLTLLFNALEVEGGKRVKHAAYTAIALLLPTQGGGARLPLLSLKGPCWKGRADSTGAGMDVGALTPPVRVWMNDGRRVDGSDRRRLVSYRRRVFRRQRSGVVDGHDS